MSGFSMKSIMLTLVTLGVVRGAAAQAGGTTLAAGAQGIVLLTRASGTPQGRTLTEAYLTQPILSAGLRYAWLQALATLDLEGLTLQRGELDLGAWGEGYVDRRHPHTYIHEAMAGVESAPGLVRLSMYSGRGFAPFGSDDPMTRPFVSYPVDHHLAQILERLVAVGAARVGPLTMEAGIFNGDEPVSPSMPPAYDRFGDSWSLRGTIDGSPLVPGLEIAASYANVKSPEYRAGGGLDQRKAHASVRVFADDGALTRYALVESARTTDVDRGRSLYTFDAILAEGALCRGTVGVGARWEVSDRPEEERLLDLFRSARPATDASILGVTRWTTISGAVSLPALDAGPAHAAPFIEVAHITADRTTAALFDPVRFYGSNHMWRLAAGVRMNAGHGHGRMGRYGVASEISGRADHAAHQPSPPSAHSRCFS